MPIRLVISLKMFNMDERPLVFIFVFLYLHCRISFDGLQSQNVFIHTLLKVVFFQPPFFHFASLSFYSYSLVFVNNSLSCLLFHVCYACVKSASGKIGYTN